MKHIFETTLRQSFAPHALHFTCMLLVTLGVLSTNTTAWGAFVPGNFKISLGESPRLLEAQLRHSRGEISTTKLNQIHHEESCKNPSIRLHDRNRVALMVQNTSTSSNEISSFEIDLQEMGFEFGTGDIAADGFAGSLLLDTGRSDPGVSFSAQFGSGNTDPTKLVIDFNGLTDDLAAIFRIDLDPMPMVDAVYPDYRGIMMGADVGDGPTTPAAIQAVFAKDGMTTPSQSVLLQGEFQEPITTSGQLEIYHQQAQTVVFEHMRQAIPEPTAAVLLSMGLAGIALRRGRRS